MYKILLADNEGIVLDSLRQIIYSSFGEVCDIRTAKTARYTRILARKFIPDIAIINVQMPGMHGFDVVREIRSYHLKCVFITTSSSRRSLYVTESKKLNILAHLTKPLFREKILPVMENAVSIVSHSQKRKEQNDTIQEKFDAVIPLLEHGLIGQMFFPMDASKNLKYYKELLNIPQNCGRIITLTFGEAAAQLPDEKESVLQNVIGSAIHLQTQYKKFRDIVREVFPLAIVGPVMGNHVLFLLPYWKEDESAKEQNDFQKTLSHMIEILTESFEGLIFNVAYSSVLPMAELHL